MSLAALKPWTKQRHRPRRFGEPRAQEVRVPAVSIVGQTGSANPRKMLQAFQLGGSLANAVAQVQACNGSCQLHGYQLDFPDFESGRALLESLAFTSFRAMRIRRSTIRVPQETLSPRCYLVLRVILDKRFKQRLQHWHVLLRCAGRVRQSCC